MITQLPQSITSIPEAKKFLFDLHTNGESYHPEDDAHDLSGDLFTHTEADHLNKLMMDIYDLEDFDPCEYLLTSKELCQIYDLPPGESCVIGHSEIKRIN